MRYHSPHGDRKTDNAVKKIDKRKFPIKPPIKKEDAATAIRLRKDTD
jgi:hypothetical protein